jgi:hypothetical protein
MFTMLGVAALSLGWGDAPAPWHTDYAQAVSEACTSDKPLFIVICPGSSEYGRFTALGVFVSDSIERMLKADYVRLIVDTETPAGKELAQKFDAGDGPFFTILDRSAKWQVFYQSGYLSQSRLDTVIAKFRRVKLSATGRPIREVAAARREVVQLCST